MPETPNVNQPEPFKDVTEPTQSLEELLNTIIHNLAVLNFVVEKIMQQIGLDLTDHPDAPAPPDDHDSGGYI